MPRRRPESAKALERVDDAREQLGAPSAIERRGPDRAGLVHALVRDTEPAVHHAPVRREASAIVMLVERQPERPHHLDVRLVHAGQRVEERAIPVEQDRLHRPRC